MALTYHEVAAERDMLRSAVEEALRVLGNWPEGAEAILQDALTLARPNRRENVKLPELPPESKSILFTGQREAFTYYDEDDMRAYGEACAKAALASHPQGEPFGYLWPTGMHPEFRFTQQKRDGVDGMPLYAAPPAPLQRPQGEPVAHIVILPTKDAGPTKFFTAPSDPRGFPVYTAPAPPARKPLTELCAACKRCL